MKSKIEKNSFLKRIVAIICAMALLMSLSMPYSSWAAAKDVTSITLYVDSNIDLMEESSMDGFYDGASFSVGTKTISVSEKTEDVPANKVAYVFTAGTNFTGIAAFKFIAFTDNQPKIETTGGLRYSAVSNDEWGGYTITVLLASAKGDVSLTIDEGEKPAVPKYEVYFTPTANFTYDKNLLIVDDSDTTEMTLPNNYLVEVEQGKILKFKVVPASGQKIDYVYSNNRIIGTDEDGYYSVTVTQNLTITVSTSNIQYTISGLVSPGEGYTVLGSKITDGKTTVGAGENYTFTVTTPVGKEDAEVTVDGGAVATFYNGQWTISNITQDVMVTITAGKAKSYTVTMPDETVGYSIKNNAETVAYGAAYTFDIELDAKYNQSTPKVTATSGTVTWEKKSDSLYTYTLKDVTANTAVSVTGVTRNPFEISGLGEGVGYTVIGTSKIDKGVATTKEDSYTFYVSPADGFGKPTVSVTGGDAVIINRGDDEYKITSITDDVVVTIKAGETKTYTITMPEETVGYSIANNAASVAHGGFCTFDIKVDAKYDQSTPKVTATSGTVSFEKKVADEDNNVIYTYKLAGVTENTTISVTGIIRNPFVISGLDEGDGYTITGSSAITNGTVTTRDNSYTFYVKADDGYGTPTVKIASGTAVIANPSEGTYIINSITDDVVVSITAGDVKTYNVRFINGTGYKFNKTAETITHNSGTLDFKITLDSAYSQSAPNIALNITSGNGKITQINPLEYTITGVTADTTITVDAGSIDLNTYTISGLQSLEGSYTVRGNMEDDGTAKAKHGSSYSFYVYADDGREEPEVTVGGKACIKNGNQYTIENITDDVAVTIKAGKKIQYNVTLNKVDGCNFVSAVGDELSSTTVFYGDTFEFKLQEVKGYDITGAVVQVDGRTVTPDEDGIYTIENITANTIVSVIGVTKRVYQVTMEQAEGATITASSLTVSDGEDYYFTVALNAGYELVAVYVDGEKLDGGQVGMNTIKSVTSNVTITVEAKKITYGVTVNTGEFATTGITDTVEYGDSVSFKVTPNAYYKVTRVTVNGTEYFANEAGVYTILNVTTNLDINVTTTPVTITINYDGGKWANAKTVTYTYDGKAALDRDQLEVFTSNEALYTFNGWILDTEDALNFDPETDKVVTLTADWVDNRVFIRKSIVLTTQHETVSEDSVVVRTFIDVSQLKYNTEFQGATIVSYGTLLARTDAVDDNDVYDMKDLVMNGQHLMDYEDGLNIERFKDEEDNMIVNYYHTDKNIDPLELGRDNFIRLSVSGIKADTIDSYRALGWIQIRIGEETLIIFSDNWDTGFTESTDPRFKK